MKVTRDFAVAKENSRSPALVSRTTIKKNLDEGENGLGDDEIAAWHKGVLTLLFSREEEEGIPTALHTVISSLKNKRHKEIPKPRNLKQQFSVSPRL